MYKSSSRCTHGIKTTPQKKESLKGTLGTERDTHRETERDKDRKTEIDRQTGRQTDKQTERTAVNAPVQNLTETR